jgi:hypothetical protein
MLPELMARYEEHLDEWVRRELEGDGSGHPIGLMTTATAVYVPDQTYLLPECARQARRD